MIAWLFLKLDRQEKTFRKSIYRIAQISCGHSMAQRYVVIAANRPAA